MSKKVHVLDLDEIDTRKKIVIQASEKQLAEIKKLIPSLSGEDAIKAKGNDVFELCPQVIQVDSSKLLAKVTIGDIAERKRKEESVEDFENSEDFYKNASTKKGFKIISDEFSDERNVRLYRGFNLIETKWRQWVISQLGETVNQAPSPTNYQSKIPDHKISQYMLSEFFEYFLYQPASETYVRERWGESEKTEEDVVRLLKLTRIDEFIFPLDASELKELQKSRNTCMHFRVIPMSEYIGTVERINKYLKIEAQKEFIALMQNVTRDWIKPLLEVQNSIAQFVKTQQTLAQSIAEAIRPTYSMAEVIANSMPDYSSLFRNAFGNLQTGESEQK